MQFHHVQLLMPQGREGLARHFYGYVLGMQEVPIPVALQGGGGCWFRTMAATGAVGAEVHVAVTENFTAATEAHPAFLLSSQTELSGCASRVAAAGLAISWTHRETLHGYIRFHCSDPFGNRVEVLAPLDGPQDS